ncbi:dolichyl-phosphate beta-glucosyltransferase [Diaphorina citri]|uniref:Dolichyl-phosphate beta-glucosyltransferase n=1 Tax=Diaphorina citri TaxID=121845 RepID=A0A1S3D3E8_DIACI|nr:dolichyl-phosphate beta-glucosyltransferase [Diaphorina citri]
MGGESEPILTEFEIHCYIALFLVCGILSYAYRSFKTKNPFPDIDFLSKGERVFLDVKTGQELEFPSLDDEPSVNLSVIVPAYNEQDRLKPMLDETIEFLNERRKKIPTFKYEIIVVSDGSTDKTMQVVHQYTEKCGEDIVRGLKLLKNRGKGGAVTLGTKCARGSIILFADADGATKFADLEKLEDKLKELTDGDYIEDKNNAAGCNGVIVGSRAHLEALANVQRSFFRNILMKGFHFIVWFTGVRTIRDTQCGFKLFTRKSALQLFSSIHVQRWAFDVELLFIAEVLHIPMAEVSVNWTEIEGSKIVPVFSWIQMGWDVLNIWLHYTLGLWKIKAMENK